MGTRGLLGLIHGSKRQAVYNHRDSYTSGLGKGIVSFILSFSDEDIAAMIRNIGEMTWVDDETAPSPELQEHYSKLGFSDTSVADQNLEDWYCLLYKAQGVAMLPAIKSGQLKHAVDEMDFLNDGLFCEWAYFIDFEEKKLEVWKGEHNRSCGLVEEISFEELKREGGGFMNRMEKVGWKEEDEEGEPDDPETDEDEETNVEGFPGDAIVDTVEGSVRHKIKE